MKLGTISGIAALVLTASGLAAQQPQNAPSGGRPGMAGRDQSSMMMMDSLNHQLDSLVARMNRTTGNQKVQAMAAVINELVSQRKAMHGRMEQMMERGRMGMMNDSSSPGPELPAKADSTADTTNHAGHHPEK